MFKLLSLAFLLVFIVPVVASTVLYVVRQNGTDWRFADRSSSGLLLPPARHPEALVRIFSARTVSWRGIVASHSWIVVKRAGAARYQRFDYTAWGTPISVDRFVPDGRWFGSMPPSSSRPMALPRT